jgi:hypothetical protein
MCEHAFGVTSQGSAYSIFRRALARGDLAAMRAAAADLPAVPLDDALEIVLLILQGDVFMARRCP